MQDTRRRPRRRHSGAFKAEVLAACTHPGASVASVALAHGVNANLVHRAPEDIRIEPRRGACAVNIAWPTSAATACAGWLRELLR
jgi:transposase